MMTWFKRISLLVLLIGFNFVPVQSNDLAAIVRVLAEDVWFVRANTDAQFHVSAGAVAPFGIGDTIVTGDDGRVLITLDDESQILLLPDSRYTILDFAETDAENIFFGGLLDGIAIHRFAESSSLDYELESHHFLLDSSRGHFAVWSIADGLNAVTVASGEVEIQFENETQTVTANQGFAVPYSEMAIALDAPLHASQVVGLAVNCNGTVSTNGSEGLRLRAGAALDYRVVDILQDGQSVRIVGTTDNNLWYRIPFQTGFGWIFSRLIDTDCDNLERFPNLVNEAPEQIRGVTELELEFLEAFYGTNETNTVFYR